MPPTAVRNEKTPRKPHTREAPVPFEHPNPERAKRLEQSFRRLCEQYGAAMTRLAK